MAETPPKITNQPIYVEKGTGFYVELEGKRLSPLSSDFGTLDKAKKFLKHNLNGVMDKLLKRKKIEINPEKIK